MGTARLDTVVRQPDPTLKAVVERLARGEISGAIHRLDAQGRVHEIPARSLRGRNAWAGSCVVRGMPTTFRPCRGAKRNRHPRPTRPTK
jgi:hypothetical protein